MTKIAIKAQKIFTADFIESNKYLVIEDNKFAGFFSKENVEKENIPVKENQKWESIFLPKPSPKPC